MENHFSFTELFRMPQTVCESDRSAAGDKVGDIATLTIVAGYWQEKSLVFRLDLEPTRTARHNHLSASVDPFHRYVEAGDLVDGVVAILEEWVTWCDSLWAISDVGNVVAAWFDKNGQLIPVTFEKDATSKG